MGRARKEVGGKEIMRMLRVVDGVGGGHGQGDARLQTEGM